MKQVRTRISHGEEGRVRGRQHKFMWRVYTYQRGVATGILQSARSDGHIRHGYSGNKLIEEVLVLFVSPEFFTHRRVTETSAAFQAGKMQWDIFVDVIRVVTTSPVASVSMRGNFY